MEWIGVEGAEEGGMEREGREREGGRLYDLLCDRLIMYWKF